MNDLKLLAMKSIIKLSKGRMIKNSQDNESINPNKKSNDIVISKTLLKSIVIGLLTMICVFLVYTYFNSGLTRKKAEEIFADFWNKQNSSVYCKLKELKILGIKKLETNNYLLKAFISYWGEPPCEKKEEYRGQKNKHPFLRKNQQDCFIT